MRESRSRGVICNKSRRAPVAGTGRWSSYFRRPIVSLFLTFLVPTFVRGGKRGAALCPGPTEGANLVYAGGFTVDQTRGCRKSDYARPCEKRPTTVDPRRRIRGVFFSKTAETKLKFRSSRLFSRLSPTSQLARTYRFVCTYAERISGVPPSTNPTFTETCVSTR